MMSAIVKMGTAFVDGPFNKMRSTIRQSVVVGVQLMLYPGPTGTASLRPGWMIGLPDGGLVVLAGVSAYTTAARAETTAAVKKRILK